MAKQREGRNIRIVAQRGVSGPVIVAVTIAASACGSDVVLRGTGGSGGTGGAPTTSSGGMGGTGGTGGFVTSVGPGGTGGTGGGLCEPGEIPETFTVEIPPEGVPAEAGQICSVMMGPVESNEAARIALTKDPQANHLAAGEVTVDPGLLPDVVGTPTIELVSTPHPQLAQLTVSNVAPTPTGFSFDASWPEPLNVEPSFDAVMILRTTFDLACPPNQTRQVEAITHVNLCGDAPDELSWESSGDECTICGIIAEMAPSPIVPDEAGDDIGLGGVLRLRLVIVARVGRTLVLLAEHDGGDGFDYDWVASDGELLRIAPDLVAWTPPEGMEAPVLQVAVQSDDAAAVASYTDVPVRAAGLVA